MLNSVNGRRGQMQRAQWIATLALAVLPAFACAMPIQPAHAASATAAAPPVEKLPSVSVTNAQVREVVESVIVSGSLVARDEILVALEIDGLAVTEILVEEGDTVTQGQVLARLQRATLDAQLAQNKAQIAKTDAQIAQARAQIAQAQANLTQYSNDLARTKSLREGGYATIEKLDQRQAAALAAEAALNSAKQAVILSQADKANMEAQGRELELKLARSEIKAPRGGIVARRNAKLGMVANGIGEPMFKIIGDGAIELEADIADAYIPRLKAGQKVAVTPAGLTDPLSGSIRLISPEVDKTTRMGRVRIALPAGQPLSVGAFGRGVIELGRRSGVTLPQSALTFGKEGVSVQVVTGGEVRARAVRLGLNGVGRIEILSGIQAGETVVAKAGTFLRDGDRVLAVAEETAR